MYINKLIKVYNKHFGLVYRIKNTIKMNKTLLIPLFTMLISLISFYTLFVMKDILFSNLIMVSSIILFVVSIYWGNIIQSKTIHRIYGGFEELEKYKLQKVEEFLKEEIGIIELEHYTLLDTLVNKEIDEIDENKSFPFINTIRQMLVAVLITGLLSYSFKHMIDGNSFMAQSLLTLYIMILGTLVIIGSFIYNNREFTRKYKLKQISKLITKLQLKLTMQSTDTKSNKSAGMR